MTDANPYDAPAADSAAWTPAPPIPIFRSIGIVFGCSVLCGLIGLAIGAMLGWVAPGYYRAIFSSGDAANFDPVSVGIGLGLTQGVVFGGINGLALVALHYWYLTRLMK